MSGLEAHPENIREEFAANRANGRVGTQLVSETDAVRVWHVVLRPGERLPVHRHVLDYFWTALTEGTGRSHLENGEVVSHTYSVGETKHLAYDEGRSMMHDLENVGNTDLRFVTVEFKNGKNEPLAVA